MIPFSSGVMRETKSDTQKSLLMEMGRVVTVSPPNWAHMRDSHKPSGKPATWLVASGRGRQWTFPSEAKRTTTPESRPMAICLEGEPFGPRAGGWRIRKGNRRSKLHHYLENPKYILPHDVTWVTHKFRKLSTWSHTGESA